jgi:hypothetical protein
VEQRRRVNELCDDRQIARNGRDGPETRRRQKHGHRPDSFATCREQVVGSSGRRRRTVGGNGKERAFHVRKVGLENAKNLLETVGKAPPRSRLRGGIIEHRKGGAGIEKRHSVTILARSVRAIQNDFCYARPRGGVKWPRAGRDFHAQPDGGIKALR